MTPLGSAACLPVSLVALAFGGHALLRRALGPGEGALDRAAATALFTCAAPVAIVAALGVAHAITPVAVLAMSLGAGATAWLAADDSARRATSSDARELLRALGGALFGGAWSLAAWVSVCATALAVLAVWLLQPWAWDALGYHLPIVHDALQTGTIREVPTNVLYVNTYPRVVDLGFVWWRALLPDDTWIDLAQLPYAVLAVLSIAATCARGGVREDRALALASLFVAVPTTTLQLASNYVDVAYAAFLLAAFHFASAAFDRRAVALAGAALGLFLATKPSAPVPFALFSAFVVARAGIARFRQGAALVAIALAIGAGKYVENLVVHGNPVWPVRVAAGPIVLPGLEDARYFFDLGVEEPYRSYGWLRRLVASWIVLPTRWTYDVRIGGFGPIFAFGLLPLAAIGLAGPRRLSRGRAAILVLAACAIASPAAFWARYVLALPAAAIVAWAVASERWSLASRRGGEIGIAVVAAVGLALCVPGLTDGRASLVALAKLPAHERAAAFGGIDGHAAQWIEARAPLLPGEAFGYDDAFGLPGQLWRSDGQVRVLYLGRGAERVDLARDENVRAAALGDAGAARLRSDGFVLTPLFRCPLDPCTVYRVEEPLARVGAKS